MRFRHPRGRLDRVLIAAALFSWLACAPWGAHVRSQQGVVAQARLQFQGDPNRPDFGTIFVTGLDPEALAALARRSPDAVAWSALLPVFTGETPPRDPTALPILGRWSIEAEGIRFTPQFPLATGIRFCARFDVSFFAALTGGGRASLPAIELAFSMPEPDVEPSAHVEAVYPSAEVIPENLLRLYVHFSAPMREQPVAGMVRLLVEGAPVELTFVEVPGGLWDRDHRRLTLLFHPGRIKRGVEPHETMGPPLRQGKHYRLEVSGSLLDAQGFPLKQPFHTSYRVGAADRTSPDPTAWRLTSPADSRSPVVLELPEPMDYALMLRMVGVQNRQGDFVRGEARLSSGETRWSFTPDEPWQQGPYKIVIDPTLEDLAGNSPFRLFDSEPGAGTMRGAIEPGPIALPFTVAATTD